MIGPVPVVVTVRARAIVTGLVAVIAPGAGGRDRPGGDRAGTGDRPGGDRAGTRDRPGAGDRGRGGGSRDVARRGGGGRDGALAASVAAVALPERRRCAATRASAAAEVGRASRAAVAASVAAAVVAASVAAAVVAVPRRWRRRRSDIELKHDISLLGRLDNGLGFYRFVYNGSAARLCRRDGAGGGSDHARRGGSRPDGYLRVRYDKIGVKFESYDRWISSGARIPAAAAVGNAK